jgi:hypothetical protein
MIEASPDYVTVAPEERGVSFGLSFQDWRMLATTALGLTQSEGAFMGIYVLPEIKGCFLDIFTADKCLTIQINSEAKQIALLSVDLDSIAKATCLLSVANSSEGWKQLGQMARSEISA